MPKHITTVAPLPARTIGLDLSDRTLRYCELDAAGTIIAEGALKLTRTALCQYLGAQPAGTRVALETGGQSAWVRDVITGLGHEAVVGNARELAAVTQSLQRTDQRDARQLARLARLDPELLGRRGQPELTTPSFRNSFITQTICPKPGPPAATRSVKPLPCNNAHSAKTPKSAKAPVRSVPFARFLARTAPLSPFFEAPTG